MGRAKMEIKYREQRSVRVNTYKSRIKGVEKKSKELSVLCGVDVLFCSFSPDLNEFHYWPKDPSEFHRVISRYNSISSQKPPCEALSPPTNLSSQEELAAITKKLEEVRQIIKFLEAENMGYSSQNMRADSMEPDGDFFSSAAILKEDEDDIYSLLEELGEDLFISDLPSSSAVDLNNDCCSCAAILREDEDIFSSLEKLDEDLSISDLPSNSSVDDVLNESYFDWIICRDNVFDSDAVRDDLVDIPAMTADF